MAGAKAFGPYHQDPRHVVWRAMVIKRAGRRCADVEGRTILTNAGNIGREGR